MKKPYYRTKGKFTDGRQRIVIEWVEGDKKKSRALPKPEQLIKLLDTNICPKTSKENDKEIWTP